MKADNIFLRIIEKHAQTLKLTVVINLKSRQAPQTKRFTVASFDAALIWGKYSSTNLEISSSDSDVALSPVYLHRHSRHTLSKDMAPLANGTAFVDMLREKVELGVMDVNADVRVAKAVNRVATTEVFMVNRFFVMGWMVWWRIMDFGDAVALSAWYLVYPLNLFFRRESIGMSSKCWARVLNDFF